MANSPVRDLRDLLADAGFGSNPLLSDDQFLEQWQFSPVSPDEFALLGGSSSALRAVLGRLKASEAYS